MLALWSKEGRKMVINGCDQEIREGDCKNSLRIRSVVRPCVVIIHIILIAMINVVKEVAVFIVLL